MIQSTIEDIFALVLLYSDGYLQLIGEIEKEREKKAQRFFKMTQYLPLEIKMLLVRRIYLRTKSLILSHQTNAALNRIVPSFYPR